MEKAARNNPKSAPGVALRYAVAVAFALAALATAAFLSTRPPPRDKAWPVPNTPRQVSPTPSPADTASVERTPAAGNSQLNLSQPPTARRARTGVAAFHDHFDQLMNAEFELETRTEAALALAAIGSVEAYDLLREAMDEIRDEELREEILSALGSLPFELSEPFFRDFMAVANASHEERRMALEALGEAGAGALPFLLEQATWNTEPELRIAATNAISLNEGAADLTQDLTALLGRERSPEVRIELFQAIAMQERISTPHLLSALEAEQHHLVRGAGLYALAVAVDRSSDRALRATFDAQYVPELVERARTLPPEDHPEAAVDSLEAADTPAARAAIAELAGSTVGPVRETAQEVLDFRNHALRGGKG